MGLVPHQTPSEGTRNPYDPPAAPLIGAPKVVVAGPTSWRLFFVYTVVGYAVGIVLTSVLLWSLPITFPVGL